MHDKLPEETIAEEPPKPELGELLRTQREATGLSLETVAQRTHIRRAFLLAFENGDYNKLPALPYAIGFLRQYASLLGLDSEPLVQDYRLLIQDIKGVSHRSVPTELPPLKNWSGMRIGMGRFVWPVIGVLLVVAFWLLSSNLDIGSWFADHDHDTPIAENIAMESAGGMSSEPVSEVLEGMPVSTPSVVEGNQPDAPNQAVMLDNRGVNPQVINAALPDEGGVFRIESKGTGWMELEADRRPMQNYDMQPGTLVNWTVRHFAKIRMDIQGGAKAWINGRKVALPDTCIVNLGQQTNRKSSKAMATLTMENHDAIAQP